MRVDDFAAAFIVFESASPVRDDDFEAAFIVFETTSLPARVVESETAKTMKAASMRQKSPAAHTGLRYVRRRLCAVAATAFGSKGGQLDNATRGRMHALLASFLSSSGVARDGAAALALLPSSKGSIFFSLSKGVTREIFLFWDKVCIRLLPLSPDDWKRKKGEKNRCLFLFFLLELERKTKAGARCRERIMQRANAFVTNEN